MPPPRRALGCVGLLACAAMAWQGWQLLSGPLPWPSLRPCEGLGPPPPLPPLPATINLAHAPRTYSYPTGRLCYNPAAQVRSGHRRWHGGAASEHGPGGCRCWRRSASTAISATATTPASSPALRVRRCHSRRGASSTRGTGVLHWLPNLSRMADGQFVNSMLAARRYSDRVPGFRALGGSKLEQHAARDVLAQHHGCRLSEIPLMPEQYILTKDPEECLSFFSRYGQGDTADPRTRATEPRAAVGASRPQQPPGVWFLKQASGAYRLLHAGHGISLHRTRNMSTLHRRFGRCTGPVQPAAGPGQTIKGSELAPADFIIQAEVLRCSSDSELLLHCSVPHNRARQVQPLLLLDSDGGQGATDSRRRKFDFRAFLLVARPTNPRFAFYYDGMLRVSPIDYQPGTTEWKAQVTNAEFGDGLKMDHDKHYWSFARLQTHLQGRGLVGPGWVEQKLKIFVKQAMLFALRAASEPGDRPRLFGPAVWPDGQRPTGAYQLFAFDFMVSDQLEVCPHPSARLLITLPCHYDLANVPVPNLREQVFMLEANGRPALCSSDSSVDNGTPAAENNRGGQRCRSTPCASWLINQTRQMVADQFEVRSKFTFWWYAFPPAFFAGHSCASCHVATAGSRAARTTCIVPGQAQAGDDRTNRDAAALRRRGLRADLRRTRFRNRPSSPRLQPRPVGTNADRTAVCTVAANNRQSVQRHMGDP